MTDTHSILSRADAERIAERVTDEVRDECGIASWRLHHGGWRKHAIALVLAGAEAVRGVDVAKVDALLNLLGAESLTDALAIVKSHLDECPARELRGRELTEAEVGEAFNLCLKDALHYAIPWESRDVAERSDLVAFARRLARPADLDAVRREAAFEALTECAGWMNNAKDSTFYRIKGDEEERLPSHHVKHFRDQHYAPPAPKVPSVTEEPKLTWHDSGYRKQVLADATGRIVGTVDDCNAYLNDRGFIGRYVTPEQARDAVVKVALASQVAATERAP